jgi:hypothetical protein
MNETASTDTKTPTTYWKDWIEAWRNSSLSQRRFCQTHDLPYPNFLYWRRKLEEEAGACRTTSSSSGFATVNYRHDANNGLALSLPNGLVLRGICADNVPVVRQLLEQL